jgi:hypothetical protein
MAGQSAQGGAEAHHGIRVTAQADRCSAERLISGSTEHVASGSPPHRIHVGAGGEQGGIRFAIAQTEPDQGGEDFILDGTILGKRSKCEQGLDGAGGIAAGEESNGCGWQGCPGTRVDVVQAMPSASGNFEVWIAEGLLEIGYGYWPAVDQRSGGTLTDRVTITTQPADECFQPLPLVRGDGASAEKGE